MTSHTKCCPKVVPPLIQRVNFPYQLQMVLINSQNPKVIIQYKSLQGIKGFSKILIHTEGVLRTYNQTQHFTGHFSIESISPT